MPREPGRVIACFQDKAYSLIRVLKPPKAENHCPERSLGVHLPQVWMGTWASFFILSVGFFITFKKSLLCKQQLFRLNLPQIPPSEASE
jgi:hypothetical protein